MPENTSLAHALRDAGLADVKLTGVFPEGSEYGGAGFFARPAVSVADSLFDLTVTDSRGYELGAFRSLTQTQVIDQLVRLM